VRKAIAAPGAPKAMGAYSPAIRAGNLLFVSGQIPVDPATGVLVEGDMAAQTDRVMQNLVAVLKGAGLDFSHVVKTTVFIDNMDEFQQMNEVYARYVVDPPPARATVQVARLPRSVKIEIELIATFG
jgi:2-iminobutanoate/2-iminopropanoate deaminase